MSVSKAFRYFGPSYTFFFIRTVEEANEAKLDFDPFFLQVASQQGTYLARLFSRGFEFSASVPQKNSDGAHADSTADGDDSDSERDNKVPLSEKLGLSVVKGKFAKPFQFLNLGILAYTGAGGALAQVQVGESESEITLSACGLPA